MTSAGSPAGSSLVTGDLGEEVPAEEVAGVGALHVRASVDDDVPSGAGRRIGQVEPGAHVGHALAVRHDRVQGEGDAPPRLAAGDVEVRDVGREGLQATALP